MGHIYKYATLTIAAASAKAVCDGFLGPCPRFPSCEIPIYHPTSCGTQSGERLGSTTQGKVWLAATIKSSDSDEPLYTRGWAFQERLLSSRMLLYGQKELTWQCQQISTESVETTFYQRSTGCSRLPVGIFVNKKLSRKERPSTQQATKLWKSIIEDYSRRDLSFREYRLPALAGIVSQLQQFWEDTYVAGLWKNCFIAHMGWYRTGRARAMSCSGSYLAPTWSWASFTDAVKFDIIDRADAEVVDTVVVPLIPDAPFGQVQSGYVQIKGITVKSEYPKPKQKLSGFDIVMDYKTGLREADEVLYLLLGSSHKSDIGLILLGNKDSTYKRIGHFKTSNCLESLPFKSGVSERRNLTLI